MEQRQRLQRRDSKAWNGAEMFFVGRADEHTKVDMARSRGYGDYEAHGFRGGWSAAPTRSRSSANV